MAGFAEILVRTEANAGRITLARPGALNALTHKMIGEIDRALRAWRDDEGIALVIVDAEGERAFCAGGDIEALYRSGMAGDFAFGRQFWLDEYRLNALIAEYPKPLVAFMHGFVMGGGVGLACHGSHRIVCESTRIAMPECGIGLIPDVGGTYLLSRAPGRTGWYLGLTGSRMDAADSIFAGFADGFVPAEGWQALKDELAVTGDVAAIGRAYRDTGPSALAARANSLDPYFAGDTALECLHLLERDAAPLAVETARAIRSGCPLSVACTFELLRRASAVASVREALAQELRFTARSMSHGEFLEGVRAQIIDKDRQPRWRTARLEDVTHDGVAAMLAPLGDLVEPQCATGEP